MTDVQTSAPTEISALTARFADCATRGDIDGFTHLWADDCMWQILPPRPFEISGTPHDMGEALVRLRSALTFFIQTVHHGVVEVEGDHASARWYLNELGQVIADGSGYFNYGLYVDDLVRVDGVWRFKKRVYHYLYLDSTPLTGQSFPPPTI